jgi:hypothetical protein
MQLLNQEDFFFHILCGVVTFEVMPVVNMSIYVFYVSFSPYGTTAHIRALSSSVLRFLNHIQLDAR